MPDQVESARLSNKNQTIGQLLKVIYDTKSNFFFDQIIMGSTAARSNRWLAWTDVNLKL